MLVAEAAPAFEYSDAPGFEAELLQRLRAARDLSSGSAELFALADRWPLEAHLSPLRANLLRPFRIHAAHRVLEVGAGCGGLTRSLGETGAQVTALEGALPRAACAAERCRDLANVQVVCDELTRFPAGAGYDVVTLVGVLEYARLFVPGDDPVARMLQYARALLAPGGTLLLAIENQLGLKYFNGCAEDHLGTRFAGVTDLYGSGTAVTFGRSELGARLHATGFVHLDWYYPFPDYKLPSVVLADRALREPGFVAADLLFGEASRDYTGAPERSFDEAAAWPVLARNGLLGDFANSLLVAATQDGAASTLDAGDWLAYKFAVLRRARYATATRFFVSNTGLQVEKRRLDATLAATDAADGAAPPRDATPLASSEDGLPALRHRVSVAPYVTGRLLAREVADTIGRGGTPGDIAGALQPWVAFLREHVLPGDRPEDEPSLPGRLLDCLPFNVVRDRDGTLHAIDLEFAVESRIPLGWVILRGVVHTLGKCFGQRSIRDVAFDTLLHGVLPHLDDAAEALRARHRAREDALIREVLLPWPGRRAVGILEERLQLPVAATQSAYERLAEATEQIDAARAARDEMPRLRGLLESTAAEAARLLAETATRERAADLAERARSAAEHAVEVARTAAEQAAGRIDALRAHVGELELAHEQQARATARARDELAAEQDAHRRSATGAAELRIQLAATRGELARTQADAERACAERDAARASLVRMDAELADARTVFAQAQADATAAGQAHRDAVAAAAHRAAVLEESNRAATAAAAGRHAALATLLHEREARLAALGSAAAAAAVSFTRERDALHDSLAAVQADLHDQRVAGDAAAADHARTHAAAAVALARLEQEAAEQSARAGEAEVRARAAEGQAVMAESTARAAGGRADALALELAALRRRALVRLVAWLPSPGAPALRTGSGASGAGVIFRALRRSYAALPVPSGLKLAAKDAFYRRAGRWFRDAQHYQVWLAHEEARRRPGEAGFAGVAAQFGAAAHLPAPEPVRAAVPRVEPATPSALVHPHPGLAGVSISVVIPAYGRAEMTRACVDALCASGSPVTTEIIVVDDGSPEPIAPALAGVAILRVVRQETNQGFIAACNRGAQEAQGTHLLFLNNDTLAAAGLLAALLDVFLRAPDAGVVGAKLVFPDGRLQEAGCYVRPDGSAEMIGLWDQADRPAYAFTREVGYVSGACLMIERACFAALGGFDPAYAPAYCEDSDLCYRVRALGKRVYFAPGAIVTHALSVSMRDASIDKAALVAANQAKFVVRWGATLAADDAVRAIAMYLPQFHPIPENDQWWGPGFTEWTNVARAVPSFPGHRQPNLPADLGFYDLRLAQTREAQAALARAAGLYGFCYYYYWFGGKRLLEQPLVAMLESGRPTLPFCVCWANENWTRRWDGLASEILIAQQHSPDDDRAFLASLLPAMRDSRYIRVHGAPLLLVYRPSLLPDARATAARWRAMARDAGLRDLYLCTVQSFYHLDSRGPQAYGFDAAVEFPPHGLAVAAAERPAGAGARGFDGSYYDYERTVASFEGRPAPDYPLYRAAMPRWDNTPRRGRSATVFAGGSPGAYEAWLRSAVRYTRRMYFGDERLVFVNAWNEWGEGNFLEPDQHFGHAYLDATRRALAS